MNREIKIVRNDLIFICDQFLERKIGKIQVKSYAWMLLTEDHYDWEDEVISEVVFEWDNPIICFPINDINMQLWKHRLKTDEDLLKDHNMWNVHIDRQKEICKKINSRWNPINKNLMIGCSDDLKADPIHGLREFKEKQETGWYIWTGEYSASNDFFKPVCAKHLLQTRPQLIKYLGLDIGYRFLVDDKGYEDVWYDESLVAPS